MTSNNLAVCIAPSLFQLNARHTSPSSSSSPSLSSSQNRRHKTIAGGALALSSEQLQESHAAQSVLALMIDECARLFAVPPLASQRYGHVFADVASIEPPTLAALGAAHGCRSWREYLYDCAQSMLKQHRDGWKKWLTEGQTGDGVEITSKKYDAHALKLWRVWVDVDAAPNVLLHRLLS
jgi:hypothetical protein